MNYIKGETIPLYYLTYPSYLGTAPIQWKSQGMKYLGINIRTPIDEIFYSNIPQQFYSFYYGAEGNDRDEYFT